MKKICNNVKIKGFIYDAQACQFLKGIKGYTDYDVYKRCKVHYILKIE